MCCSLSVAHVIRDLAIYQQGRRTETTNVSNAINTVRADGGFLWLGLVEPTESEFEETAHVLGLHPIAVEDAVQAHQRPKFEVFGDTLFSVLRTVFYDDSTSSIDTGEVMAFCGPGFIVTVRHGLGADLADTRAELEARPELLSHGPYAVLHAVLDRIVDEYIRVTKELEHDVSQIEERVFDTNQESDAAEIYFLKREVIEFKRAVKPLRSEIEQVMIAHLPGMDAYLLPFMRDVTDHVLRVSDAIDGIDELLGSVLTADLSQLQVRQNEDMRRITAWVAVSAVPTMVAGIYGMNFDNMPELHWRYGYFAVVSALALGSAFLWSRFRKSGWL